MKPGDVILVDMPRFDIGSLKLRPALILADLPGSYDDVLVCGISTQLHQEQVGWDEVVHSSDPSFAATGLRQTPLIRLSHLLAAPRAGAAGVIGRVPGPTLERLRQRLADLLQQKLP